MNNRTNNNDGNQSHYEILGVHINADLDTIKKAYKAKAIIYHPDKVPVNYTQDQKKAHEEMFKKVSNAYETLSDPVRKGRYDILNGFNQPTRPTSSPFFTQSYSNNNSYNSRQNTFNSTPFGNSYSAASGFGCSSSSQFGFSSGDFDSNSEYFNYSFGNTSHSNNNFYTTSDNYKPYPTNDFNANKNNANNENSESRGYPNTNYKTGHNNHDGSLKNAIQTDNIEIVKMLLENNVKITNDDLCEAISLKRSAIIETLLTKKPLYYFNINPNDSAHRFDLMAILSGDVNTLQILERHRLHNFITNHHINTSEWLIYAAYSGSMEMMKYLIRVQNLQYLLRNEQVVKQILIAAIDESHVNAKNVDNPSHRVNLLTFLFKDCQLKITTQELRHIIFPMAQKTLNLKIYAYLQSRLIDLSKDVSNVKKDTKMYGRFSHLAIDGLDMLNNVKDLFKLYYYLNPTHTGICSQVHENIKTYNITLDQLKSIILNEKTFKKQTSLSIACLFYYASKNCVDDDNLAYLHFLINELKTDVNAQNRHGYLLIHHCYFSSKEVDRKLKYLILNGANIYAKDPQNKSIFERLEYNQEFRDLLKNTSDNTYNNRYHFYDHYNNRNHNTKYGKNNRFFKTLITDKQSKLRAIDAEIDTMQLFKTQQNK